MDREEQCNRKRFVSIGILKITEYSDVKTSDIFITLNETAAENWSFGQGIAQMVKIKGEKMNLLKYILKENERNVTCICSL